MRVVLKPNKERCNIVFLADVDSGKIYVSRSAFNTYKLSRIPTGNGDIWMFCGLFDSFLGSSGVHKTMEEAIEAESGPVYEFDNAEEFLHWMEKP